MGRNVNTPDSSNFRGIASCLVYGKLFDNIVLNRYSDKLMTTELQFGFKAKSSTNMCTMVLKKVIAYYLKKSEFCFLYFLGRF